MFNDMDGLVEWVGKTIYEFSFLCCLLSLISYGSPLLISLLHSKWSCLGLYQLILNVNVSQV